MSYSYQASSTTHSPSPSGPERLHLPSHGYPTQADSTDNYFSQGPSHSLSPSPPVEESLRLTFVENIARSMNLSDVQSEHLAEFYRVGINVGNGLNKADLAARIYAMAASFASENRSIAAMRTLLKNSGFLRDPKAGDKVLDLSAMFQELAIRLEDTFHLTDEQKVNIRRVCQNLIYKPTRVSFKNINLDVEKDLRRSQDKYRLNNIFGSPARELQLASVIKKVASNVRNQFRQDIRDSVTPGHLQCSLNTFTINCALKYRTGSITTQLEDGYAMRNALLRRFAIENPALLASGEDEHADEDGTTSTPPTKKRKTKGGRITADEDFWSRMDKWLDEGIKLRGKDLKSDAWREYITETIALDDSKFAAPTLESTNVTAQAQDGVSVANTTDSFLQQNSPFVDPQWANPQGLGHGNQSEYAQGGHGAGGAFSRGQGRMTLDNLLSSA